MTVALSQPDVERFRTLVLKRLGLEFDDGKLPFLADVIRERMDVVGVGEYALYLERVTRSDGVEIRALASHLTVGETYFCRYWDHFRAFAEIALPDAVRRRADTRRLRILSAGCASGEEAHTLAMLVREHLADAASWSVEIRGIDVNPVVIERATRGRYSTWSLRETAPELRERYFRASGKDFELDPAVRAMVSFEERNLIEPDPQFWRDEAFDIVFCRNVMMYFATDVMSAQVARFARALCHGGHLFLGHAETLRGVSQDFHLCHTHGAFYYRRKDATPRESAGDWTPTLGAAPSAAGPPDAGDSSWFAAIQRASERIATLVPETRGLPGTPATAADRRPNGGASSLDLAPAVELVRQERFADALDLLGELPVESAIDPDVQLLRAVVLTNSGQLALAAQLCEEILAKDELCSGAHYLIALSREHAGDRAGAIEHDQIATYLDSRFAMPRLHLGLLARRANELDEARTQLHLALGLLATEDASRVLLFGGGFSREALTALCRAELRRCGGIA